MIVYFLSFRISEAFDSKAKQTFVSHFDIVQGIYKFSLLSLPGQFSEHGNAFI